MQKTTSLAGRTFLATPTGWTVAAVVTEATVVTPTYSTRGTVVATQTGWTCASVVSRTRTVLATPTGLTGGKAVPKTTG
jgi:hypothetical protein